MLEIKDKNLDFTGESFDALGEEGLSWLNRIQSVRQATAQSVIETAKLLHECQIAVGNEIFTTLRKKFAQGLGGEGAVSKYLKIAGVEWIHGDAVLLPSGYSRMYAVAQLTQPEYKSAKEQGIITPDSTRAQLEEWRASISQSKKSKPSKISGDLKAAWSVHGRNTVVTISIPMDEKNTITKRLREFLQYIAKRLNLNYQEEEPQAEEKKFPAVEVRLSHQPTISRLEIDGTRFSVARLLRALPVNGFISRSRH